MNQTCNAPGSSSGAALDVRQFPAPSTGNIRMFRLAKLGELLVIPFRVIVSREYVPAVSL